MSRLPDSVRMVAAVPEDFAFLLSTHRACMRESVEAAVGWEDRFQEFRLRRAFVPSYLRIIEVDGERIGTVCLTPRAYGSMVSQFYVLPSHQGRGIGSQVLDRILADADAEGHELRLGVLKGSPARRFYVRRGFVPDPVRQKRAQSEDKLRRLPSGRSRKESTGPKGIQP